MENIIEKFKIQGCIKKIEENKNGLVNKSYIVSTTTNQYLIQIINHYVFENVEGLMNNIYKVTTELKRKGKVTLDIVMTTDNKTYYYDKLEHKYYRMFKFLEGLKNVDLNNDLVVIEAGKTIGNFQLNLSDYDYLELIDTIKDFHNIESRVIKLIKSYNNENVEIIRKIKSREMFNHIIKRYQKFTIINDKINKGIIPIRIAHNDTKLNNIMFDKNNIGVCLVDLDTVMPGTILFDFGDAVRSICSSTNEDDFNLDEIDLVDQRFVYLCIGYLSKTYQFITKEEVDLLVNAVGTIILECAIRFLTDYLDNDIYFKTEYDEHNFDRASNQFKLYEKFIEKETLYTNLLDSIYSRMVNYF